MSERKSCVERQPILPECEVHFENIQQSLDDIAAETRLVRQAVVGNGDPSRGLASRVQALETGRKFGPWLIAIIMCVAAVVAVASALVK